MRPGAAAHALSDATIVARVLAGQQDEYGELVRRYQSLIYRHLRGLGIEHDASLDLVQDAFVRAYLRLADCREPAHFRAWLFRIARNLSLDHLKNVRQQCIPLSRLPGADEIADHDSAADLPLSRTLRHALSSLPVALREAFLLKHDAGYTYEEMAELTDASPSAVKMRVHRAREALLAFLEARGLHTAGDNPASADRLGDESQSHEPTRQQVARSSSFVGAIMKTNLLLLFAATTLTLLPARAAAQAATAAQATQAQAPAARIDAALQAAARARIPVALLESKVAEGEAKRIAPERIASAVESRLQSLLRAASVLDRARLQSGSESELAVTADALQAGVSENALVELSRNSPAERRVVAVAVLTDLVRLGTDSEPALLRVNAALGSSAALANLHAELASQLRLGGLTSTLDALGIVRIK